MNQVEVQPLRERDASFKSATTQMIVQRYQEEEKKRETLGWLKHNMNFRQSVMALRDQVQEFTFELCKEESKLDYDRMAQLVSEYEGVQDEKGVIAWALKRTKTIAPTIA